jgi:hypothetical protein
MKRVSRWVSMIWLPASIVFAQAPDAVEPQSAVTVVFAPEYREAPPNPGNAAPQESGTKSNGNPVPFAVSGGGIGIRLGDDFAVGAMVTMGADGRLRFQCARLHDQVRKAKAANSATQPSRKDAANEK